MKKAIILYYSKNGSNRFLAEKTARELDCEIEELKPRLNAHLLFLMGLNFGNRKLKANLAKYDLVILCGPIWVGKFIAPLKAFAKKHGSSIKQLVFITCCGSSFEMKEKKFGHELVFNNVKTIFGDKCIHCEAFPITLVVDDDKKEDADTVMKTRLNDSNFRGEISERFDVFLKVMSEKLK